MKEKSKIVIIVGARPQFIKIAFLLKELEKHSTVILIHTGQHYDYEMSSSFFDQIQIRNPDYNLNVGSGTQGKQTGDMLSGIEEVLIKEKPSLVLVVGDTNSTLAGALAASKLHIKIAHIEAGMRNFDKKKPEEVNRIICDHISDYFFASTENAKINLLNEGLANNIFVVGDLSNDIFLHNLEIAEKKSTITNDLSLESKNYYALTIHKSKNTESKKNLEAILTALNKVDKKVIFPIHPRTLNKISEYKLEHLINNDKITCTKALPYFDMIKLLKHSSKIITDSGGIQKEAYTLKTPCITTRKTEWVETVNEGWNIEVDIHNENEFIDVILTFNPQNDQSNFLGEGETYKNITNLICQEKMF